MYPTDQFPSLRTFINDLSKKGDKYLKIVDDPVDVKYEITAYAKLTARENKVLLFRNLKGYPRFNLVTNLLGSEERIAMATGLKSMGDFLERWNSVIAKDEIFSAKTLEHDAPVKENVTSGESVDLFALPIPIHYSSDGSRTGYGNYITSGLALARDPENDRVLNLSFTRIQPFAKNMYAFDAGSHGNMWRYLDYCKREGLKLEISVIIGAHPLFYLLGSAFIRNEYAKAEEIAGFRYTDGISNNLPVPSESEIVIEAEYLPDETFDEGPFAEYTGYMGQDSTRSVAHVKTIMTRKYPIYYDIQPSNSSEHINLFSASRSAAITASLIRFMPKGPEYRIVWPHYGSRFLGIGYVKDGNMAISRQFGTGIVGTDSSWGKVIFINNGKTDLDIEHALVNLAQTNNSSGESIVIFRNMYVISSDLTTDKDGSAGKVLFITSGKDKPYSRIITDGSLLLSLGKSSVVISHELGDGDVNIAVADDIDPSNIEEVGWALATRMNPQYDLSCKNGIINITAMRKHPEIPSIPNEVMNRVKAKLS